MPEYMDDALKKKINFMKSYNYLKMLKQLSFLNNLLNVIFGIIDKKTYCLNLY